MRPGCNRASLLFVCAVLAHADVNYDVVQTAKWPPAQTDSGIPWTNAGMFAISPKLYAPVLEGAVQEVIHVHIKGHKLLAVGPRISRIYDLDTATLTSVNREKLAYVIESLKAVHRDAPEVRVSVQKTGKTFDLYGQEATEYGIIATKKHFGKNKLAARILCWAAKQSPSAELDEFKKRWSVRTNLPFPGDISSSAPGRAAYAAINKAQAEIPGYVWGFVTKATSSESQIDLAGLPSNAYDASHQQLPNLRDTAGANHAQRGFIVDPLVHELANGRLIQINLLNFSTDAVNPKDYAIPLNFKQSRMLP